ncbi:hypothetical protein SNOG_00893 [Parastagonospora nodorum SN15]|uniref:Uncharacterized protein n=1 Tax=Phaeosphaeria nodorum (strain SN15 / ATCC MYA-4574 / FGSC 10173) TaxID=321614 RepID=Q0V521_PHANO|nr:hypothetical protein SNOG_00893 [Parastagonospora nodorum SN15]EAT92388.1 hypothetical protein SNOG_00893 [Parastagonospora nodorum SN15]
MPVQKSKCMSKARSIRIIISPSSAPSFIGASATLTPVFPLVIRNSPRAACLARGSSEVRISPLFNWNSLRPPRLLVEFRCSVFGVHVVVARPTLIDHQPPATTFDHLSFTFWKLTTTPTYISRNRISCWGHWLPFWVVQRPPSASPGSVISLEKLMVITEIAQLVAPPPTTVTVTVGITPTTAYGLVVIYNYAFMRFGQEPFS